MSSAVSENPMEEVHLLSRQLPRVTHVPRAAHLADVGAFCDPELRERSPMINTGEEMKCESTQLL